MEKTTSVSEVATNKSTDVIIEEMETTLREEVSKFTKGSQMKRVNAADNSNATSKLDLVTDITDSNDGSRRNWKVVILPEKKGLTKLKNQVRTKDNETTVSGERRSSRLAAKKMVDGSKKNPVKNKLHSNTKALARVIEKCDVNLSMKESITEGIVSKYKDDEHRSKDIEVSRQNCFIRNKNNTVQEAQVTHGISGVQTISCEKTEDSHSAIVEPVNNRSQANFDPEITTAIQQNTQNRPQLNYDTVGGLNANKETVEYQQSVQECETTRSRMTNEYPARQNDGDKGMQAIENMEIISYVIEASNLTDYHVTCHLQPQLRSFMPGAFNLQV